MPDEYVRQEAIKNALVDKFKSKIGASRIPTWNDAFDAVTNIPPAADVVEVRHGRFIGVDYDGYADGNPVYCEWICSQCGCVFEDDEPKMNYCPHCGAKMDLPEPPKEEA